MLKKIIFRALLNFQFAFVLFWAMCLFSGAKLSTEVMWRVILQIALGERLATACFFTEASGIIRNGGNLGVWRIKLGALWKLYFLVVLTVDLDECGLVQNKYSHSLINTFQYYFYFCNQINK